MTTMSVLTVILAIAAFYIFLSVYLLFRIVRGFVFGKKFQER